MRQALAKIVQSAMPSEPGWRVPTLADTSTAYADLVAKRDALMAEIAAVDEKISATPTPRQFEAADRRFAEHEARVAALLGEPPPAEKVAARGDPFQRRADLQAAVHQLELRIARERSAASAKICAEVEPAYRDAVAKICKILIDLHAAHLRYAEIAAGLNGANIAWAGHLRPMPPAFLGATTETNGNVARYLREAADFGFLDRNAIPKEFA